MINILDKKKCCGCASCVQTCPKNCLIMEEDFEGFLYPKVRLEDCINCGLCEQVCPVINRYEKREPLFSYACRALDSELVSNCSSGGVVAVLSRWVLEKGGVVFGARFDRNWEVYHDYIEDIKDLYVLSGSKYVQSRIGNSYLKTLNILKGGRFVLFVGTPCQIAGLNHFLRRKYDNLLTVDIICHSSPSPKIWRLYLRELTKNRISNITCVNFRNKSNGWSKYTLDIKGLMNGIEHTFVHQENTKNIYMRGFLQDLYNRPSCSECPAHNYISGSDLTVGDFWGYNKYYPEKYDEKGMSVVCVNTSHGNKIYNKILMGLNSFQIPYKQVEPYGLHITLTTSIRPHSHRYQFFRELESLENSSLSFLIKKHLWFGEFKRKIKRYLLKVKQCIQK